MEIEEDNIYEMELFNEFGDESAIYEIDFKIFDRNKKVFIHIIPASQYKSRIRKNNL